MGILLISTGLKTKRLYLRESNIIGRDYSLGLARIADKRIPNFWIEIRYIQAEWAWRILNGEEDTKASGAYVNHKWRKFSRKIVLAGVSLELIDESLPIPLIDDMQNKTRKPLLSFPFMLQTERGFFIDTDEERFSIHHGEPFVLQGHSYIVWLPQGQIHTAESRLILTEEVTLDIEEVDLVAIFSSPHSEIRIKGEAVRILLCYAKARLDDAETGGWRSKEEIFEDWIALGGNKHSDVQRINWERNKLGTLLTQKGMTNVERLFEKQRERMLWKHRLFCKPKWIQITN